MKQRAIRNLTMRRSSSCSCLDMCSTVLSSDLEQQEKLKLKLKEFREVLRDVLDPEHDDQFLLRWLKARDFDIVKAEKMIRESFKFRKKMGIQSDGTMNFSLPEIYKKYPVAARLGFAKDNSVARVIMMGVCDYKGYVHSLKIVDMMKILVYELENDLKMIRDKKKTIEHFGRLEEKTTFILDFQGFSLKQLSDKTVINYGIQLLAMYQDNYPETLKVAYLINVPSYFNWIFNIFKPFLNPVTLSKMKIYRTDEWKKDLRAAVDVKLIPAFIGGDMFAPDEKCSDLINWDSKVDAHFYLKQNTGSKKDDLQSTTVPQRGSLQIPVTISCKGTLLKWTFCTQDYNIHFGVFFQDQSGCKENILPVQNIDCQVVPEENEILCDRAGTYILNFDNSYSWLTAKKLRYKFEVMEPKGFMETNNN